MKQLAANLTTRHRPTCFLMFKVTKDLSILTKESRAIKDPMADLKMDQLWIAWTKVKTDLRGWSRRGAKLEIIKVPSSKRRVAQ